MHKRLSTQLEGDVPNLKRDSQYSLCGMHPNHLFEIERLHDMLLQSRRFDQGKRTS